MLTWDRKQAHKIKYKDTVSFLIGTLYAEKRESPIAGAVCEYSREGDWERVLACEEAVLTL